MVSFVWTKFTDIPFIGEGSSTYKRGRITLNGKANCPQRMGELLTYSAAPARWLCPYACVIRTLANIICK